LDSSFLANASLNNSKPPAHATRPPSFVWNPLTTAIELPAHKPSPPLSAASTNASAFESSVESAAKLSAGACKIGKSCGLLPRACGIPENQIGGVPGVRMGCKGTLMGMTLAGVSRLGKWDIRGVPGGGKIRENSDARDVRIVCFGPRTRRRLVLPESSVTKD